MKKIFTSVVVVSIMFMSYCSDTGTVSKGGEGCLDPHAHDFYNEVVGITGSEQGVVDAITFDSAYRPVIGTHTPTEMQTYIDHVCPDSSTAIAFYNTWQTIIGSNTTTEVNKILNTTVNDPVTKFVNASTGSGILFTSNDTPVNTITISHLRLYGLRLIDSNGAVSGATNVTIKAKRMSTTGAAIVFSAVSLAQGMYEYTLIKDTTMCTVGDVLYISGSYDYQGITHNIAPVLVRVN